MVVSNVAAFNKEVGDFLKNRVPREVKTIQTKMALAGLRGVVKKTPVDKRIARGGWQISIGIPPTSNNFSNRPIGDGAAKIMQAAPFSTIYIGNNVSYITVLEYGGFIPKDPGPSKDKRKDRRGKILVKSGFSVQAPHGMVSVTLQELRMMFK
jgi:hypothetical protein